VTATGARGASTALVGSPQTIADSILDYVDLGAELISIRGYDNLNDAIDYGRYVLPKVRAALKEREDAKTKKRALNGLPAPEAKKLKADSE
jgi:alkanesulfonate monooxygenase